MVGFSGILGPGYVEDWKMMKDKLIDGKKSLSRFRGKLVKMIKDVGSKLDDYLISPKNFIAWGYEWTEKDFFNELSN